MPPRTVAPGNATGYGGGHEGFHVAFHHAAARPRALHGMQVHALLRRDLAGKGGRLDPAGGRPQGGISRPRRGWLRGSRGCASALQTNDTHRQTIKWIDLSAKAGRPWFVCLDEIGPSHTGVKPDNDDYWHDGIRRQHLWGNLMAGGAGVEWYFGYNFPNNDLNCEDWRSRDHMWDLTRYALEFFHDHLPFAKMEHHDELNVPAGTTTASPLLERSMQFTCPRAGRPTSTSERPPRGSRSAGSIHGKAAPCRWEHSP